jgi:hypothetical protein
MALISMRQLLDHAAENNYGVPVEGRSSACMFPAGATPVAGRGHAMSSLTDGTLLLPPYANC